VNVIDENIVFGQRQRLIALKIHVKQIGFEIGRRGMQDKDDVIPLLHSLHLPTFFTRDRDYYEPTLRHSEYCLVLLDVFADQTAEYVRRFLRHEAFRTRTQRMGSIVRVHAGGLNCWRVGVEKELRLRW
jgi:hypothetical protein